MNEQETKNKESLRKKISDSAWYKYSYDKATNRTGLLFSVVLAVYFICKEIFGSGLNIGFWSYDNSILNFQDSINPWLSPLCLIIAAIFYFFVLFKFIIPSLITLPIITGTLIGLVVGVINPNIVSQHIEYYTYIIAHFYGLIITVAIIFFIHILKFGPPLTELSLSTLFGALLFLLIHPIVYEVTNFHEFNEPNPTFGGGMVAGILTSIFITGIFILLFGLYEGVKNFFKNLHKTKKDGAGVTRHKIISLSLFLDEKIKKFFMWLIGK